MVRIRLDDECRATRPRGLKLGTRNIRIEWNKSCAFCSVLEPANRALVSDRGAVLLPPLVKSTRCMPTRTRWISLCTVLLGCGTPTPLREWTPADHGQPQFDEEAARAQAANEPTTDSEVDATARAAQALWNVSCATCHGRDGRGGGVARPPGAQLPDLASTAWQDARTDDAIAVMIRDGRGLMPAFGSKLHPEAIVLLVAQVRTLREESQ